MLRVGDRVDFRHPMYAAQGVYEITEVEACHDCPVFGHTHGHISGRRVGPDGNLVPMIARTIVGFRGPPEAPGLIPIWSDESAPEPVARFSYGLEDVDNLLRKNQVVVSPDGAYRVVTNARGNW